MAAIENYQPMPDYSQQPEFYDNYPSKMLVSEQGISPEIGKLMLVPADIVKDIKMSMLGYEKNEGTGQWEKVREPLMNQRGVDDIMRVVILPRINRDTMLSDITEQQCATLTYEAAIDLIGLIYVNYMDYGLDKSLRVAFIGQLTDHIFLCLRRAIDGNEREMITRMHNVNQVNQNPNPMQHQGKGFLGFKGWFK